MMESVLEIFSETSSNIFYHQSCEFSFSREPNKASLDACTPNFQESSPQSTSRKLVELVYIFLRVWLFFFFFYRIFFYRICGGSHSALRRRVRRSSGDGSIWWICETSLIFQCQGRRFLSFVAASFETPLRRQVKSSLDSNYTKTPFLSKPSYSGCSTQFPSKNV